MYRNSSTYFRSTLLLFAALLMMQCAKDKSIDPTTPEEEGAQKVPRASVIAIVSTVIASADATYEWTVSKAPSENYALTNTTSKEVSFAAAEVGVYELTVMVSDKGNIQTQKVKVAVNKENTEYKTYINKVFEFKPAPGQFINDLPAANDGDTYQTVLARANNYLTKRNGDLLSLGAFGGYIVFGFDHTILNVKGKRDFRILGNAFWAEAKPNPDPNLRGGSSEAGVIMVSYDKNKNGLPDDEWFEIEGAGHQMSQTIRNYEITYYRPDANKIPVPGATVGAIRFLDTEYIYWKDNQGKDGYLVQNNSSNHTLDYWPKWMKDQTSITFKGTKLPDNAIDESGNGSYFLQYAFLYGYADNAPNSDDDSAIDIDWAVDKNGKKVQLPGVDFIKVYNGLNQQVGWLGETSTEIMGATDLHLLKENIPTRVK